MLIKKNSDWRLYLWLAFLCVIAFAIRWTNFSERPLWGDEVDQWLISSSPTVAESMHRLIVLDRQPPAFGLLTQAAMLSDLSPHPVRLISLISGILAIPIGAWVGRVWSGKIAEYLLPAYVTISELFAYYSGEARPYALGALSVLLLLGCAGRFASSARISWAVLFSLAASFSITVQYANSMLVAASYFGALAWLRQSKSLSPRVWAMGLLSAALPCVTFMIVVLFFLRPQTELLGTGIGQFDNNYFHLNRISEWKRALALTSQVLGWAIIGGQVVVAWKVALTVLVWIPAFYGHGQSPDPRRKAVVISLVVGLMLFLLAAGLQSHPFGAIRHCLPLVPLLFLAHASGVAKIAERFPRIAVVFILWLVIGLCYGCFNLLGTHKLDFPSTVDFLSARYQQGDAVVSYGYDAKSFDYYLHNNSHPDWKVYTVHNSPANDYMPFEVKSRYYNFSNDATWNEVLSSHQRVWLVEFPLDPFPEQDLSTFAKSIEKHRFRRVVVTLWRKE